jgi:hypothetical protein
MMVWWEMGAEFVKGSVAGADLRGTGCKCGREKFCDDVERLDDVLRLRGRVEGVVVVCRVACMGVASTG